MIDQTDEIGIEIEEGRAKIEAVRERLRAALDGGADDEAARRLLGRLSASVAKVEHTLSEQAVGAVGRT